MARSCSYAKANMNPRAGAEVILDQHEYLPGSTISGKVVLKHSFYSLSVKKFTISVHGKEKVKGLPWKSRSSEFLADEIQVWEAEDGKSKILSASVCAIPFSFKLRDHQLPPTYDSDTAKIKYFVKASIKCDGLKTFHRQKEFTVMMGNSLILNPMDIKWTEVEEKKQGVAMKLHLSSTMLFDNHFIKSFIHLHNDSPHTIHRIQLNISQITTIHLCENDDCINSNNPNPPCKKTDRFLFLEGILIDFKVKPGESQRRKILSKVVDEEIYPTFSGKLISCSYKHEICVYRMKYLKLAPVVFEVDMTGYDTAPRYVSQWKLLEEMAGLGFEKRRKMGNDDEEKKDLIEF